MKVMDPILCYTPMLKVPHALCQALLFEFIIWSLTSKTKEGFQQLQFSGNPFCIHLLGTLSHSPLTQISIGSDGHSWSLPRKSEPRSGQSRSSRLPSLPGWWYHQNAPGRRCLWSARWRRAPRWWRRGQMSPRSASHKPQPAFLLLDASPAGPTSQV